MPQTFSVTRSRAPFGMIPCLWSSRTTGAACIPGRLWASTLFSVLLRLAPVQAGSGSQGRCSLGYPYAVAKG
jgi:hypothetical protein